MKKLVRVKKVKPLEDFRVKLVFTNGTRKEVDLKPYLWGPVFESIRRDREEFLKIRVDGGTIAWPNGADLCPDVLYYGGTPPWARAYLRRQKQHA